jgi:hypothetical protein
LHEGTALPIDSHALPESPLEAAARDALHHLGDSRGLEEVVRVERIDEDSVREANRLVQRDVRPAIVLRHEADRERTGGKRPADDVGGAVGGTIIDDDELDRPVRLGEYALERLHDVARMVVDGHDDAHERIAVERVGVALVSRLPAIVVDRSLAV